MNHIQRENSPYSLKFMKYALFILLLFTQFLSFSQNIQKVWDKRYGGNGNEDITTICETEDNNFLIGGGSDTGINGDKSQYSRGETDFWVIKMDVDGNKIWDKRFGGPYDDYLLSIKKSSTGYYYLGGYSYSDIGGDKTQNNRGDADYWLVKMDKNGELLWDKRFGGRSGDYLKSIIETEDKGFLLCGYSYSGIWGEKTQNSKGSSDFWVIKIDSNGTKLWDKAYGGTGGEMLNTAIRTKDNAVILAGASGSGISGDKTEDSRGYGDFWLIKITQEGAVLWDKRFGSSDIDAAFSVMEMPDGNLMIGGYTWSESAFGDKTSQDNSPIDFWVVHTTATGAKIWDKTYGSILSDSFTYAIQTKDGGFLLGGVIDHQLGLDTPLSNGYEDFYLIKIDASGNFRWSKNFGGASFDELTFIHQINDDTYFVGGYTSSLAGDDVTQSSKGGNDFWVLKLKDCYPSVLNISGNNTSATYRAGETLVSTQQIISKTDYFATNGIILLPDFTVQNGSVFKAEIKEGCNN